MLNRLFVELLELVRARLLYGEGLRRQRRRVDARDQLRTVLDMLEVMGMDGFSERARRELRATGETARKCIVSTRSELTAQETQVAKLARDGLSNLWSAHPAGAELHNEWHVVGL